MTGRHLPGCQYELSSTNHQNRESLIHSVEKGPPARMEASVIFLLRFALKRANLKSHKIFGLADTCCFEVYLLRVTLSDARIESRRQIMYVTQFTPKNIVDKFTVFG